jgi:hypothetical protein
MDCTNQPPRTKEVLLQYPRDAITFKDPAYTRSSHLITISKNVLSYRGKPFVAHHLVILT